VTGTPTIQWTPGVRLYRGIPYAARLSAISAGARHNLSHRGLA